MKRKPQLLKGWFLRTVLPFSISSSHKKCICYFSFIDSHWLFALHFCMHILFSIHISALFFCLQTLSGIIWNYKSYLLYTRKGRGWMKDPTHYSFSVNILRHKKKLNREIFLILLCLYLRFFFVSKSLWQLLHREVWLVLQKYQGLARWEFSSAILYPLKTAFWIINSGNF